MKLQKIGRNLMTQNEGTKTEKELQKIAQWIISADKAVDNAILMLESAQKFYNHNELSEEELQKIAHLLKKHREEQGGFSDTQFYGSYFQEHCCLMRQIEEILDKEAKTTKPL